MSRGLGGLGVSAVKGTWHTTFPVGDAPWVQTPKWHWRFWFGYRMRQADDNYTGIVPPEYDRTWKYRTYQQHARKTLEDAYNDKSTVDPTTIHQRHRSPNYVVGPTDWQS